MAQPEILHRFTAFIRAPRRTFKSIPCLLGDRILEANKKILSTSDSVKLFTGALIVESPRKDKPKLADDLKKYTSTTKNSIIWSDCLFVFWKLIMMWQYGRHQLNCFVKYQMKSANRHPFPFTFYYGYTNGCWVIFQQQKSETRGYEVEVVSPFTEEMPDPWGGRCWISPKWNAQLSADRSKGKKKR